MAPDKDVQPLFGAAPKRTFRRRARWTGVGGKRAYRLRLGRGVIRPERALIDAPAEHREGWIAIIRSRHSGRRKCANRGHSPTTVRGRGVTGNTDPAAGSFLMIRRPP